MRPRRRAANPRPLHASSTAEGAADWSWGRWIVPLAIVLATFAVFSRALSNGFVNWDDDLMLIDNPHFRGLGWAQLRWMVTTFHNGHFQPLSWITLGLDYMIWGIDPFGYHLTNLLWHAANAVIFYFVCRLLFARVFLTTPGKPSWQLDTSAAFAAILFALHPLRVESVVWATERRDVLSAGFFLIAIYYYLRAHEYALATAKYRRRWLVLAFVAQLLSLMAKATAITLPLLLVILDIYPLQRLRGAVRTWFTPESRSVLAEKSPFLLLSVVFGLVALWAQQVSGALRPVQQYFFTYRLGQAFYGVWFYLWKTLVPIGLSPLYELPYDFGAWTGVFVASAVFASLAGLLVFVMRRRWPWLAACWLYYLIVLSPVLGVAQSGPQLVADRYSYLSCLSWAALLGGISLYWMQRQRLARLATVALVILATGASLGTLTRTQIGVWRDAESLWNYTLQVTPNTAIANYNLGKVYEATGRTQESVELYRRAVRVNPSYADAHYNLARLLSQQGQIEEAIAHYRETLKFKPDDVETHNNLGRLWAMQGNFSAASAAYQKALALDPHYAKAYFNLGRLLVHNGEFAKAIENFQQALKLAPDTAEVHAALGDAYARSGSLDQAIMHLEAAARLKPALTGVQTALARLRGARGSEVDRAAKHLRPTELPRDVIPDAQIQ